MASRGRRREWVCARLLIVASLVSSAVLYGSGTASAHERGDDPHNRHHHGSRHGCVNGHDRDSLVAQLSPDGSTVTVRGRRTLCSPVVLLFGAYTVPDTWDRVRFDATAVPQHLVSEARGRLVGDHVLKLHVRLPCGNVQVDLYHPPRIVTVGRHGHGGQMVTARLWHRDDCRTAGDVQAITATIPRGVLVLSTPCSPGSLLDLLSPGSTDQLAVTDLRSGTVGWAVTVGTQPSVMVAGDAARGHYVIGGPARLLKSTGGVAAVTVTITVY